MRRRGLWMDYIYVRKGADEWGDTNSQVVLLCAVLEDPETPVLTEIRDLILRVYSYRNSLPRSNWQLASYRQSLLTTFCASGFLTK